MVALQNTGLAFAHVLQPGLCIGKTKELVEIADPEGGDPIITEVEVKEMAEVGSVIDVTGWAWIQSYVERGQLSLLSPEQVKQHMDAQPKAEAEGGEPKAAPRSNARGK